MQQTEMEALNKLNERNEMKEIYVTMLTGEVHKLRWVVTGKTTFHDLLRVTQHKRKASVARGFDSELRARHT